MTDLHQMSLAELRAAYADGLTAEQAVTACAERITATEPRVHALLATCLDAAKEEARALDKGGFQADKPLWGVPVTIKDALCTKGLATTAGSRMLENFTPFYDAFAVEKLRQAGAVILGKNNMDEFAMGSSTENSAYTATHNPWDATRVPGGSSGGSAASVAACQCVASLGSDTGGSIRQPASLCGCVGLKPTYGRVSRFGLIAYGSSLDQVGPLTRTVADSAAVLQAIAGHDKRDSTCSAVPVPDYMDALNAPDLHGLRIGVPQEFFAEGLAPEVEAACRTALDAAKSLGATLVDVRLPHTDASIAAYYIIAMAEASSNLARFDGVRYGYRQPGITDLQELYVQSRSHGFGEEVQRRIMLGTYVLSSGYYDAYFRKAAQVRRLIRQDYLSALEQCDVICGPVSPVTAWEMGSRTSDPLQMYLMDIYTLSLNLAGLPGLSVPVGAGSESKLPVGMQLMGRAFDEATLLRVGSALEKTLPPLGFAPC